jgi:hypothetical protein
MFSEEGYNEYMLEKEKDEVIEWILSSQMSDEEKWKKIEKMTPEKMEYLIDKLSDRIWRINNLYAIVDENWEKIDFKTNFIQWEIVNALFMNPDDYIRHIILKYRQGWVSTLFTILLLDEFLWGWENIYNVIIAHERKLLISLFKKIRFAFDNMDPAFKAFIPKMDSDNANELFIKKTNNRLGVSLDVRWETPTRIHITELAWREPEAQSKLLLAVNPLRKTKITIESTANWVWNPFYNLVQQARIEKWTYKLLFYPWFIDYRNATKIPQGYEMKYDTKEQELVDLHDLTPMQLYWRRQQIEDAMAMGEADGEKKFQQENPANIDEAFVSSWSQVFNLSLGYQIGKMIEKVWDFEIYGEPEDAMVFGVDTAEWWVNSDYSVIVGMSRTGKVLIVYRKKVEDFQLAEAMDTILSMQYNWKNFLGTILVERNKWAAFVWEAKRYSWFYLILKWRDQTAINDTTKEYYGWYSGWVSKELVIRDFRKAIYNRSVTITKGIYEEICTYVYTWSSANAMSGKNDDMIVATMIAYHWVLYEHYVARYSTDSVAKKYDNRIQEFDAQILSWDLEQNTYSEWEAGVFNS